MIIGTGIDIIEIERIKKAIANKRFVQRVFTSAEQAYCEGREARPLHLMRPALPARRRC